MTQSVEVIATGKSGVETSAIRRKRDGGFGRRSAGTCR